MSLHALERTRTAMPFGTTPSRWRVYQFHHQGKTPSKTTGPTGLEPASSRVTVECSNQTELRPPDDSYLLTETCYLQTTNFMRGHTRTLRSATSFPHSPKGNRTP